MTSGVYKIANIKTSEVYIGSSKNIERRFYDHKRSLNNGSHHSIKLQKAWNEYGESAFTFCLLEEILDPANLIDAEQRFIDEYKSWQDYNIQDKATISGAKNLNNPYHCDRPMRKNGKANGAQQYRCSCGFTFVDSDRKVGRPTIKGVKLTPKEKEERWKQNNPKGYREACDRRNEKARKKYAEKKQKKD